ncbi:transcriptional regulator [Roseospira goensis]|uniref:DNA-binding phage protein n=1 Tax=Roseospira goensis TaxID=391922 RepID=A0A7W6S2S2_9PROT|nr:transcriptional regulator [Roseospira goensis]MBB4287127.1 DNA-binding phage protein [Roseospira goensis]
MALTRDLKDILRGRVERDEAFRAALFEEALTALLDGDVATGKVLLRDYVDATVGVDWLAASLQHDRATLIRALSTESNAPADVVFAIVAALKAEAGVDVTIAPAHREAG